MADRIISHNTVCARRRARGWSQAELAERAGISRAAVSAIEGERLSPAVHTALALASAFECSVEELFGSAGVRPGAAPLWAWPARGEGARYWEATVGGVRRLYPVEANSVNATRHDGTLRQGVLRETGASPADQTLVLACCDPAAGLLAAEYARETGLRLLVFPRGGQAALELVRQGLAHVAGVHYSTAEEPGCNGARARAQLETDFCLLRAATWESGIALAQGDRSRSARSVVRRPLRWAAREAGSAARECLDQLFGGRHFSKREVNGHASVAEAVRSGWAGAGICVRFAAEEAGLQFLPLRREDLDLCFPAAARHDPRVQALVRLLRGRTYRRLVSELPGYDARQTGELMTLSASN